MSTNLDKESARKILSDASRQTLKPAKEAPLFPRVRGLISEIRNYGIGVLFGRRYKEVTTYRLEIDNSPSRELTSRPILRHVGTTRRVRV